MAAMTGAQQGGRTAAAAKVIFNRPARGIVFLKPEAALRGQLQPPLCRVVPVTRTKAMNGVTLALAPDREQWKELVAPRCRPSSPAAKAIIRYSGCASRRSPVLGRRHPAWPAAITLSAGRSGYYRTLPTSKPPKRHYASAANALREPRQALVRPLLEQDAGFRASAHFDGPEGSASACHRPGPRPDTLEAEDITGVGEGKWANIARLKAPPFQNFTYRIKRRRRGYWLSVSGNPLFDVRQLRQLSRHDQR